VKASVVVVTGAFGVLGRAVASAAVEQGACAGLLDIAASPPTEITSLEPTRVHVVAGADVSSPSVAQAAMGAVSARFGRIDALINVAGGFRWERIEDRNPTTWESLYRLNVLSALNASVAALPYLRRSGGGSIVNIGAAAALKAGVGMGAYAASKSAVHRLTESLADELKVAGITVNAVLPSIIDTPANRRDMPDADPAMWVTPAALAAVILFLVSGAASAVTGALIPVTGRG
jgi:NAD(P)-dependent dehydrogenase (short-subunit alcohol dehydrogenase family)